MTGNRVWHRAAGALLAAVTAAGLLAGCTNEPEPAPAVSSTGASGSPSAGAGGADLTAAAAAVTRQYLTAPEPTVLGSARGTIFGTPDKTPGTLDVLEVIAGARSTMVRWRLKADRPMQAVSIRAYTDKWLSIPGTTEVALVAKQADQRLLPVYWRGKVTGVDCSCGFVPTALGSGGVELSDLYPALPASVTEVQLEVPGFPPVTVPVSRR